MSARSGDPGDMWITMGSGDTGDLRTPGSGDTGGRYQVTPVAVSGDTGGRYQVTPAAPHHAEPSKTNQNHARVVISRGDHRSEADSRASSTHHRAAARSVPRAAASSPSSFENFACLGSTGPSSLSPEPVYKNGCHGCHLIGPNRARPSSETAS
jgi:hypothetical protein